MIGSAGDGPSRGDELIADGDWSIVRADGDSDGDDPEEDDSEKVGDW
jgi:hypothetical protein